VTHARYSIVKEQAVFILCKALTGKEKIYREPFRKSSIFVWLPIFRQPANPIPHLRGRNIQVFPHESSLFCDLAPRSYLRSTQ
jgi:hypothetical protein